MTILISREGPVGIVTLNRPEAMNALSQAMRADLYAAITTLNGDDSVSVIILTGAGERAFTAGLDLKELSTNPLAMADATAEGPAANPVRAIETSAKPVIGAINGVAITGGFEVALACDVLIASTNARFADTHGRVGIMPGWGLSQKLSRLIGIYRAKELSLTGNFIDATTAERWGLVNHVVAPYELLSSALKMANDMASMPALAQQNYKRLINDGFALNFGAALAHETSFSTPLNNAVTPDTIASNRETVQARGREQG
jgi:enoyl-CoA hydratase